ncbi:hypothetical protein [Acidaminococcus intestini]|jgi:hypothetical protein|uniref:hypothetical protein n=1 Tax=Acidaminococcus intestini TaxID=187327 RepID=UPI00265DE672|nr:hypothetical protein [Acidaminococcus intestini]
MDFIAKAKAAFGKVHLCILLLHLYPFCPFDALHPITYFLHFFTLSSKKENAKNLTDPFPVLYWMLFEKGRAIFAIPENWQINCVFPQRVQKRSSL